MPEHTDTGFESSTNRWMSAGVVLMALFVLAFPLYRLYEPGARAEARELQETHLQTEGESLYRDGCASCHGGQGEGVDAPALNSKQFLDSAVLEQIIALVSHGVPGTAMVAWSVDLGGPLTSEQIRAVASYVDSWRAEAPDRPDWRAMLTTAATSSNTATTTSTGQGPEVAITLTEVDATTMVLTSSATTMPAGEVTFVVTNTGNEEHEFVLFRTDLAITDLPFDATTDEVMEEGPGVTHIDEIGSVLPGETKTLTVTLEAGNYAMICNLASHYRMGMRAVFSVG
ncbi:MAG: c-type cytochrome [Acidimicrobiia bacterium]|nr:c-type cytochrome [Acidimicrobiia bacterium]